MKISELVPESNLVISGSLHATILDRPTYSQAVILTEGEKEKGGAGSSTVIPDGP